MFLKSRHFQPHAGDHDNFLSVASAASFMLYSAPPPLC